jgi:hypothetical protein
MSAYTDQLVEALTAFDEALGSAGARLRGRGARARIAAATHASLSDNADRAGAAASQLRFTCGLSGHVNADRVDLQVRLQGDAAAFAAALGALGTAIEGDAVAGALLGDAFARLDEAAQDVATAIFPSAVDGHHQVNDALWEFEPLLWRAFTTRLADTVHARALSADDQVRVQGIAGGARQAFDDVNALLTALADNAIVGSDAIGRAIAAARDALQESIAAAQGRMTPALAAFGGVVATAAEIAATVDARLAALRIPVFPAHEALGALAPCVSASDYDALAGVQRLALLAVGSRLQAITIGGRSLVDPAYDVRVTRVFADRVHLDAARALVDDVAADTRGFEATAPGLRRHQDGAFTGTHAPGGSNLRLGFARQPGGARVDLDAGLVDALDAPRLFGPGLIAHLTGRGTGLLAAGGCPLVG